MLTAFCSKKLCLTQRIFGPSWRGSVEAIEDKIGDTMQGNPIESNALRRQGSIWEMALRDLRGQVTYQ